MPEPDAYRVLQVDPQAHASVIQAAYRVLARRFHPDGTRPDPSRMRELNRAYAVLRTAEARRAYDQARRSPTVMTPVRHAPPPPATIDPWRRSRRVEEAAAAAPAVLDFGRYAGWRLADLARHDADYLRWLSRHSSGIRYREQIASLLPNEPDMTRRANSVA